MVIPPGIRPNKRTNLFGDLNAHEHQVPNGYGKAWLFGVTRFCRHCVKLLVVITIFVPDNGNTARNTPEEENQLVWGP